MTSIDAYIYIIIGLLGVAYPVLLQVVARLDEKYSSDKIVELFDEEWENKAFRYSLISSLFFLILWSLKLPAIIQIDGLDFFIENSASSLLAINSILLVIFFFYFVNKILIYYTPTKFIPYLIERNEKTENDFQFFVALSELLLLFIKQQQTNYSKTLSDFFYTAFRKIRDKQINQPVVYPDLYYEVVYKAIEELAILKEKRNYLLEHRTSGEIWLLGELQGKEISEITYSWMWRNLLLAIRYQQDDLIINHWETCHQYYVYSLRYIHKEYDRSTGNLQVSNQEAVDKRLAERQRFIEFHYALGGLLTYKQRYGCIKRMFSHTQSQPPKYELLPESMYEIFKFYFDVRDPYERKYTWISHQYPFPDLSGLNADYVIKKWIMSYMAILFLRQYTIDPYLITMKPLDYPPIPTTQGEIKQWIDGLDFFKKLVSEHLQNTELLKILGLDFITAQWCEENQKPFPITFIESLKSNLEGAYNANALNLPISDEKVLQFENSTTSIIETTVENIMLVNNEAVIEDDNTDKWYVNGQRMLQSKDAFSNNPEVHHIDYDSFLASMISRSLNEGLSETFFYKRTKSLLLKSEDIFKAIDRLTIDSGYVIINFGLSLDYFINQLKVAELSSNKYKDINIYSFNGSHLVRDSLFILKKSDLPNISTRPIDGDLIAKYTLKKISDTINLYSSVIDLNNTSEEIFNENKQDKSDEELRKSVLLSIIISTEFKWKKEIEVIQLNQHSEYLQKGIANKLDDVKPIDEEKPSS
ncbi:MAG: hypothetical protein PHC31_10335 [Clostridia bacterium]|nr:hypothetical protein [Clostridia bacterium]MDD3972298.1 hypothetical protein [Clostridia bacterium]